MAIAIPPVPQNVPIVEAKTWYFTDKAIDYFTTLAKRLAMTAQLVGSAAVTGSSAAIVSTAIQTPTLQDAIYRFSYVTWIVTAASVSSSVQVSATWTTNGVAQGQTFAAMTGNTTGTQQRNEILIPVDGGTTVSYSVAYATVGVPDAVYDLDVFLEQMP